MKISTLTSLIAPQLTSLISGAKTISLEKSAFTMKMSFHAFNKSMAKEDLLLEKSLKDIDLVVLREVARSITGDCISYQGFISSQLQNGPIDSKAKVDFKRVVAINRMLALINATVDDMKAIECRRIAHSKG
jgi:hypothetical protein